jgi:hypothetical protein
MKQARRIPSSLSRPPRYTRRSAYGFRAHRSLTVAARIRIAFAHRSLTVAARIRIAFASRDRKGAIRPAATVFRSTFDDILQSARSRPGG